MAIRLEHGEYLSRTIGLLNYNAAYTRACFFYMSVDWNDWGHLLVSQQNPGSFTNYDHCGLSTDGTTFRTEVYVDGGGAAVNVATLSVGSWYFLGMRRASATAFDAFVIPLSTGVLTKSSTITTNVGSRAAISHMFINDLGGYSADGRYCGIKEWSTALTDAELLREALTILPRKLDNLHAWFPVFPGSGERTRDYSGNGYNWTENGVLSDEDPPPVSWGAAPILFPFVAGGGATTIELLAASFGFSPQAIQPRLAMALTTPSFGFTAQVVQPKTTVGLTAAAFNFVAHALTVGSNTLIALTAAAFAFAGQAIQTALWIHLSTAAFGLIGRALDVTGAMAAAVSNWLLRARRRWRR